MRAVADHVARTVRGGNQVVVVISAMGKETDDLLRIAAEVSDTRPGREMDMLVTAGERKAMALLCMAIADTGIEAESFTGSQAGFLTDSTHRNAKIVDVKPARVVEALAAGRVAVVGGAQGVIPVRGNQFLGGSQGSGSGSGLGTTLCDVPGE
jgi:aspartate kinase